MSSFRRVASKEATSPSDATASLDHSVSGLKPWVHSGLGIVSSGHKKLDELVGGGYPLGTLVLIEVDSHSNYGDTLMLYSVAEGLSHKHSTLIVTEYDHNASDVYSSVPYNQTLARKLEDILDNSERLESADTPSSGDKVTSNHNEDNTRQLSIAWQYGKYLKPPSSVDGDIKLLSTSDQIGNRTYCCSYDLSRRMSSQPYLLHASQSDMAHFAFSSCLQDNNSSSSPQEVFSSILASITAFIERYQSIGVTRIYLPHVEDLFSVFDDFRTITADAASTNTTTMSNSYWSVADRIRVIASFLLDLKHEVRDKRVSLVMSHRAEATPANFSCSLRQVADTVLTIESFAGKQHSVPYEFNEFQGFIVIRKVQTYGTLAPFRPAGSRFGLKRDRRKLHIEPLHLPPEESRAFGTAGTTNPQQSAKATSDGKVDSRFTARQVGLAGDQTISAPLNKNTSPSNSVASDVSTPQQFKTPLAASIAALKAARQAAAAEKAATRPNRVPIIDGDAGGAPLRPGTICGDIGAAGTQQKYDF